MRRNEMGEILLSLLIIIVFSVSVFFAFQEMREQEEMLETAEREAFDQPIAEPVIEIREKFE
jgi:hypothetical protein